MVDGPSIELQQPELLQASVSRTLCKPFSSSHLF